MMIVPYLILDSVKLKHKSNSKGLKMPNLTISDQVISVFRFFSPEIRFPIRFPYSVTYTFRLEINGQITYKII